MNWGWAIPMLAVVALYTTYGAVRGVRRYGALGGVAVVMVGIGNAEIIVAHQGNAVIPGGVCVFAGLIVLCALLLRDLLRGSPSVS